jgi:hypothetical protein
MARVFNEAVSSSGVSSKGGGTFEGATSFPTGAMEAMHHSIIIYLAENTGALAGHSPCKGVCWSTWV